MNERQLRERATAELGKPVPEAVWQYLNLNGYVGDALAVIDRHPKDAPDAKAAVRALMGHINTLMDIYREGAGRKKPPGRLKARRVRVAMRPYDTERARALTEYKAFLAQSDPAVRAFRDSVLGGRTLSTTESESFLNSPALRILPREYFLERGIPLVGHSATATGRAMPAWLTPYVPSEGWEGSLRIEWPGGSSVETYRWEPSRRERFLSARHLGTRWEPPYLEYDDFEHGIWPRSVLSALSILALNLAIEFYWRRADARWFVLTGAVPEVPPLDVRFETDLRSTFHHGRIVLSVDPAVSADGVKRAYSQVQHAMLRGDNRGPSPRNLAVFRFVTARADPAGSGPSYFEMMREWNRAHPEQPYENRRIFSRDYRRGKELVCLPRYRDDPLEGDVDEESGA